MRALHVALAFASLALFAAAGVARADAFTAASFEVTPSDVRVVLDADGPIREPRIRTDEGFVRVWFPGTDDMTDVEVVGDGSAVRFARARPGASESGVVVVRLGDMRRLPTSAVRVERAGSRATIVLARSALPAVREPSPAPVPATTPAPEPVIEAAPSEAPVAAVASEPTLAPEPDVALEEEPAPAPLTASGRRRAETTSATASPSEPEPLGIPASSGTSPITIAIVLALFVAAFFAIRHFAQRDAKGAHATIKVIASHRLGPKQQLVLVRALGQDHLLAVDAAKTERLSSVPTPAEPESEQAADVRRGLSLVLGGRAKSLAPEPAGTSDADRFSAALLAAAEGTRDPVRTTSSPAPKEASSEAVAGLLRLRSKVAAR